MIATFHGRRRYVPIVDCLVVTLCLGCGGKTSRVDPPRIDPAQAGSAAIGQYDADGDGELSRQELAKLPGVLLALGAYDRNDDDKVSAEEIAARIRQWQEFKIGTLTVGCRVTLDGALLEGATVKMIPEKFLGEYVKPASGTTTADGGCGLAIAKSDLSPDQQTLLGVHCGIYKIEVTHPTRSIPARYNRQTILGQEIALGTFEVPIQLSSQ